MDLKKLQRLLKKHTKKGMVAIIDLNVSEDDVSATMTIGQCNRAITFEGKTVKSSFPLGRKLNPGRGKSKGSKGENEVAKALSKWYGVDGAFRRSAGSGARFTRFNKDTRETPGDLIVPEDIPWVIEIKCDETFDFERWLFTANENSLIEKAWQQCLESTEDGKVPVVIARKNYSPWYIFFDQRMLDYMQQFGWHRWNIYKGNTGFLLHHHSDSRGPLYCAELDHFLKTIPSSRVKKGE